MDNAQSAKHSKSTKTSNCPSCGRFVGPYSVCPYCGAHLQGRISVRVVKTVAILLATVGLAFLWWLARHTPIPTLSITEVQGSMNLAYVQVAGKVVRSLSYDPESHYLSFWLADETGQEIWVAAYRDVTQALLDTGRVPALGDEVSVAGTLRIREDFTALTLNIPEHLIITRPEPVEVQLDSLTLLDAGLRLRVAGEVGQLTTPYAGLTLIAVRTASGEITVAVDEVLTTLSGPLPEIIAGQGIEVVGAVSFYGDRPQLVPADVRDIQLTERPVQEVIPLMEISNLSLSMERSWVRVRGEIVKLQGLKGGVKATLDDGTAQVIVLLWERVYAALPDATAFDVGAQLELEGELQVYNGELEIVPESATGVSISQNAPGVPWVEISSLSAQDAGQVVCLRGVLGEPVGFSAGIKVPLDDGTGEIPVLLWSNMVAQLPRQPVGGELLEVTGEVSVYRGELELIPRSLLDWHLAGE
ncbi:MAG: hypothetical protein JW981_08570 [Anaerolineae bacterium]|nr:hypothetical protein [Anaerolineae bacterium]